MGILYFFFREDAHSSDLVHCLEDGAKEKTLRLSYLFTINHFSSKGILCPLQVIFTLSIPYLMTLGSGIFLHLFVPLMYIRF